MIPAPETPADSNAGGGNMKNNDNRCWIGKGSEGEPGGRCANEMENYCHKCGGSYCADHMDEDCKICVECSPEGERRRPEKVHA